MRPAHVLAKPPADDVVALLEGPWRFAIRLMMISLSFRDLTASEIAALFEYDPRTVRRWINRYNREGVAGLEVGAPRHGDAGLGRRIRMVLREPGAWTVKQLRRRLGYPAMSLATLARRAREQASWAVHAGWPRAPRGGRRPGGTAPGDRGPARGRGDPGRGRGRLLPWLRSTWIAKGERQEVMTPGKNQKHSIFGAIELATGRWYQIAERANSATFIEFLGQILDAHPKAPFVAIVLDHVSMHPAGPSSAGWLATVVSSCSTAPATLPITTQSSGSRAP